MTLIPSALRITPPPTPRDDETNSRDATTIRLARNVALLCGVDFPDRSRHSIVHFADYNALTSADIGRGAPRGFPGPDKVGVAAATLSKYGPETKAALTLAATNELFATIEPTVNEVLRLVSLAADAQPLADAMRICAWASVIIDAYEAQPALLVAALKARAIQRGALQSWNPWVTTETATAADPIDYGYWTTSARRAHRGAFMHDLRIVDSTMHNVVAPLSIANSNNDANNFLLVESVISRFGTYLTSGSIEAGLAIVRHVVDGNPGIDVTINRTGLLSAFTESNMRLFDRIVPTDSQTVATFDAGTETHWRRLLPRIPTVFEMSRLDQPARQLLFGTLLAMLKTLRNMREILWDAEMRRSCSMLLGQLADSATECLGADALVTIQARIARDSTTMHDTRTRVPSIGKSDVLDTSLAAGERLHQHYVRACNLHREEVSAGTWLSFIDAISPDVSTWARDLADRDLPGDRERSHEVQRDLRRQWLTAFRNFGIDIESVDLELLKARGRGLASYLHNWSALVMDTADRADQLERARLVALFVVLPLREEAAAQRRNDRGLRFTLQMLIRGLSRSVDLSPGEEVADRLTRLLALGEMLLRTSRARQVRVETEDDFIAADANLAICVLQVAVKLRQHGTATGSFDSALVDRFLEVAWRALGVDYLPGTPISLDVKGNARASALSILTTSWQALQTDT